MKNLLILIVAVAVFLHFYPQPELEELYQTYKAKILEGFSDATDTRVRLRPQKIYTDLEPHFKQFNETEINALKEITNTRKGVIQFHNDFCEAKRRSASFHVKNQELVCRTIASYSELF